MLPIIYGFLSPISSTLTPLDIQNDHNTFHIAYRLMPMPGVFRMTKIVTFVPRFCIVNTLNEIIRIKQVGDESPLIAIVGNLDSFIAKNSDIVLNGTIEKEIDPLGVVPTTSSLVALAIGDALASVLMVQRGFDKKDFVRNHPGGELGKQLALKVESVMHPLNDVAQIDENDSISSCASKMTKKPLGAALHLDNDRLKGIVTEGDLRKSIASTSDLSNSILDFINNNPISINPSISILDAMKVMEDRHSQISCLPVIDSDGKCLGLVTLHDLYQTKLV